MPFLWDMLVSWRVFQAKLYTPLTAFSPFSLTNRAQSVGEKKISCWFWCIISQQNLSLITPTLPHVSFPFRTYPPVNKHSTGKSPSWIGNTSSNGGFSIAMLDYRSVPLLHVLWHGRTNDVPNFVSPHWVANEYETPLAIDSARLDRQSSKMNHQETRQLEKSKIAAGRWGFFYIKLWGWAFSYSEKVTSPLRIVY